MTFARESGASRRYRRLWEERQSEEERNRVPEDYIAITAEYYGGDIETVMQFIGNKACRSCEEEGEVVNES